MADSVTISVPLPVDPAGYIDRECPAEPCGQIFKVLAEDWNKLPDGTGMFCPFCRYEDDASRFVPPDVQRYLNEYVHAEATRLLNEALGGFTRQVNRTNRPNSLFSIKMTHSSRPVPIPISPEAQEEMMLRLACRQCGSRYAVVGAGFFCPHCGHNSAVETFTQSIAKVRTSVAVAERMDETNLDRDTAAEVRRDLLENQYGNLVTAFQRYGEASFADWPGHKQKPKRNVYQRLDDASKEWEALGGRSFETIVGSDNLAQLKRYYQQRHVFAHPGGIVDQEYLDKTGDTSVRIGQRLVARPAAILDMADLVERLGVGLANDLPVDRANKLEPESTTNEAASIHIPGLAGVDEDVFRRLCDISLEIEDPFVSGSSLQAVFADTSLDTPQFVCAIEVLQLRGLVRAAAPLNLSQQEMPTAVSITDDGLALYLRQVLPDYGGLQRQVARAIHDGMSGLSDIAQRVGQPDVVVATILGRLERRGLVSVFRNGRFMVATPSGSGGALVRFLDSSA